MQNYLKANQSKITQEEARRNFKMRCMVSDVKANFKWKYENVDCEKCEEEENQEHVISCNMIDNLKKEEIPKNDEIWKNDEENQIQIEKRFIENMKIRKKLMETSYLDQVTFKYVCIIAKLSPAQSNFNSVGWAKLALIPTFTHQPPHPCGESTEKAISRRLLAKFRM